MIPTPPVPDDLVQAIRSYRSFIIIGHKNPDADCITSQIVLANMLEYLGKETLLASPGPFDRHEIQHFESRFQSSIPTAYIETDPLVIVVDCSSPDRIEPFNNELKGLKMAVIDHHASGSEFGDIRYVFTRAFSVTFMIYHMMKSFGIPISQTDAQLLLFGLAGDTGFFRHVPEGRSEVFKMAAELSEAGASPRAVHHTLFGDKTFRSRQLLGMLLSRAESRYGGKLLVSWETFDEHRIFGERERDSDALYSQLLAVEGCQVVLYIRQEGERYCTVGLRAAGDSTVDVGMIAAGLGGGGHRKAAGTYLEMPLEKALTTVIGILAFYLS